MNLHIINAGSFKLDGGAMFGVVPKSIWNKLNPADDQNLCTWATRCLLIEEGNKKILIDTGIGDKQDDKFKSHFQPQNDYSLLSSLEKVGVHPDDITDVVLTHLHFDHCGGAVSRNNDQLITTFPNANYWSNEKHWNWAINPNAREAASFLKENILPIKESGQLQFIQQGDSPFSFIELEWVSGHTTGMMLPIIHHENRSIAYAADLIPSAGHIRIPYVMAYDMQPHLTLQEKQSFLGRVLSKDQIIFFEHDPVIECASIHQTERGIVLNETLKLTEVVN